MTLYTARGGDGTTTTFGCCGQRTSKSSVVAKALATHGEPNPLLGTKSFSIGLSINDTVCTSHRLSYSDLMT